MFGGTQQGGGGSNLVRLTALFPSRKGNGVFVGSLQLEGFATLFKVMKEAHDQGVELMFMASPDKKNQGRAVLYVAPGRNKPQAAQGGMGGANPFAGLQTAPVQQPVPNTIAPAATPFTQPSGGPANPPKDDFDSLLESL